MSRFHGPGHLHHFPFLQPPSSHFPHGSTSYSTQQALNYILLHGCFRNQTHSASWVSSSPNQFNRPQTSERLQRRSHPCHCFANLPHHPSPILISPIMPGSVSSPSANSSLSPVFIPFRCLQAIIMYPLSQAAHIKFFSSFLINQSLNPSKPFNRASCSSLNSGQFPQVSDNVVTRGWMQGSSCWLSKLPECREALCMHTAPSGRTPCLTASSVLPAATSSFSDCGCPQRCRERSSILCHAEL